MIEVHDLARSYNGVRAVDQVSFTIERGEIIGLLGPNGAGKTTTMKMLCGYLEPSAGRVLIDGIDMADNPKAAQARIGYLPENLPVYPDMTVVGYLEYAASLKGLSAAVAAAEIRRAVRATDLDERAFSKIGDLSRGLKQRVGVAQALLGGPSVLVLDEPTNGLDPTQAMHMRALIKDLARAATVILSTHILSEVEATCDRVLMVNRGRLVLDAHLSELSAGSRLLLHTDMPLAEAQARLADLGQVTAADDGQLALTPASDLDWKLTASGASRRIVEANFNLWGLAREARDLASLFNQLSHEGQLTRAEGARHAA